MNMNSNLYNSFRTGFSFAEVRRILANEQRERKKENDYMFVTRKTVLGRWREIKKKLFEEEIKNENS